MAYLSLYRKYRSQTFSDLIGQDHIVRTLQNAVGSGRIAHSYLFTGPRGTGKTSTARLLAKALNCEVGPAAEPDDTCEICRSITAGSCIDVIEMDAASESGVEEIRQQIVESIEYRPMICRYKVYIIDEVHDLSAKAFDALLKTIEEPPEHIIFILATTEFNKVPPTIRSRCQKFEFHRASMQDLVSRLNYVAEKEGVTAEPAAIAAIARMADGGYRDALTLLEQAIVTASGTITLQLVYDQLGLVSEEIVDSLLIAMKDENAPAIIEVLENVGRLGRDPKAILESIMYRMSDLTRASYQVSVESGQDATREASLFETASRIGRDNLLRFRGDLAEAHKTIRDISLPRLWLEAELLRLATKPKVEAAPVKAPDVAPHRAPNPQPVAAKPVREASAPAKPAPVAPREREHENPPPAPKIDSTDPWFKSVEELSSVSKSLGMKLSGSTATVHPDYLSIELGPQAYEWLDGKPAARDAILKAVQKNFDPILKVEYAVRRRDTNHVEPGAVELPAEGSKLEQLARQVFGADSSGQRSANGRSETDQEGEPQSAD